jgi:NAD(P)-dependent dehydrogenase (short-subunit alcohol dehydrogenase family)
VCTQFLDSSTPFSAAVLFNNAGSLGDLSATLASHTDNNATARYFTLNVASVAGLTYVAAIGTSGCAVHSISVHSAAFLRATVAVPDRAVVNVSSLMAIKTDAYWSLYAAGKAARDALIACAAAEVPASLAPPRPLAHSARARLAPRSLTCT